jgi:regulatory protein
MRSSPRKLTTEEALYAAALRALMRRAYSVFEMRTYLERRSEDATLARHVLARIRQEKFLDDARYALEFARTHARTRRQGRYRIARELRARGVPDRYIESAIEQTFTETDETALVKKVIERRLRAIRGPLDQKKLASLYRMLQRSGFDSQLIHRELRAVRSGAAATQDSAGDRANPADLPEDYPSDTEA